MQTLPKCLESSLLPCSQKSHHLKVATVISLVCICLDFSIHVHIYSFKNNRKIKSIVYIHVILPLAFLDLHCCIVIHLINLLLIEKLFFFYYYNHYVNDWLLTSVILFVMVWYFFQKWNCWVQGYNEFLILINHPVVLPKDCSSLYSQKYLQVPIFLQPQPTWILNFC